MSSPSVIFTNKTDSDRKSSAASTATTSITTTLSAGCTSSSASARIYTGPCMFTSNKFPKALAKITDAFLDSPSWNSISKTSKDALCLFRQARNERKGAYHLLSAVFIAEPQSVDYFLSTRPVAADSEVDNIISSFTAAQSSSTPLAPTAASVLPKLSTTTTSIISTTSASTPTQLSCIVLQKSHGKEVYLSRKTVNLETIRTWTAISPLEAAAWCGDNFIVRQLLKQTVTSEQKKESARQLQGMLDRPKTAENGIYLASFKSFMEAYNNYIAQSNVLLNENESRTTRQRELSLLDKHLPFFPNYGLQELLSYTNATAEPERSNGYVQCDSEAGFGTEAVLYRARLDEMLRSSSRMSTMAGAVDLLSQLCENRTSELSVIIRELSSVDSKEEDTATASHSQVQHKACTSLTC